MNYRFWNNLLGWAVFLVAFFTYFSTMEPTTSFWDCGEFIASSYKLQVGHPPGAPLFLMLGRFFALFANDPTEVAYWINMVSVLSSALTITFLFWTITILARKFSAKATGITNPDELPLGTRLAVLGSGLIGALAYTFSDTFWFSAVEAEVYATSSLFTALVFWAMLRWDESADQPHADRWLVLIAYLMGLSIGVHLLNLLTIPALAFIYYFRRFKPSVLGIIGTLFIGVFFLVFVQYGIIPGFVERAASFEWLFTNWLGLPFYSGAVTYVILTIAFIGFALWSTTKKDASIFVYILATIVFYLIFFNSLWWLLLAIAIFVPTYLITKDKFLAFLLSVTFVVPGLILWFGIYKDKNNDLFANKGWYSASSTMNLLVSFFTVILLGYTSYAMIIIRSNANTPMDENNPADMYSLLSYLNREQYGSQPLFMGPYYDAEVKGYDKTGDIIVSAYTVMDGKKRVNFFTEKLEAEEFIKNAKEEGKNYTMGQEYLAIDEKKEPEYDPRRSTFFPRMWSNQAHHIAQYKSWGNVKQSAKPTFSNNLAFFVNYHIVHMYNRYFMWNFVGRQNDIQGNKEPTQGNWISGINFIDELSIVTGAPQDNLPESASSNPGRNTYYFLPLLLGLGGLLYHLMRNGRNFVIVFMLFFLTGYAIVLYLNQTPLQPRERDYAYAGSFYAFSIWIGLGVYALYDVLEKLLNGVSKAALAGLATVVCLGIPALMGFQNYDDHNRAGRYTARDFAFNYLNTCKEDGIMFTNGDNDTFPLWYAQEVEGVRTDVRIVNLSLLNTDWYIDQMKRAAYKDGNGVPFGMSQDKYLGTKRDQVLFDTENPRYYTIKEHFKHLMDENSQVEVGGGQKLFYFKSNKFIIPIDSAKVCSNGTVPKGMEGRVLKEIRLEIKRGYVLKSDLMILSLLNNFNWDRPLYFAITVGEDFMGLQDYFQLEGMAYRLVPFKANSHDRQPGEVNTDIMYKNVMENFVWGNMENPDVYLDETNLRMTFNFRNSFVRLASKLVKEGKNKKAIAVLDKAEVLMPDSRIPYNYFNLLMADTYIDLREFEKADKMLTRLQERTQEDATYFARFKGSAASAVSEDAQRAGMILQTIEELKNKLRVMKSSPQAIKDNERMILENTDTIPVAPQDTTNP